MLGLVGSPDARRPSVGGMVEVGADVRGFGNVDAALWGVHGLLELM